MRTAIATTTAILLAAGSAHAATETFRATLAGATEVPPHTVPGTGTAEVKFDTATRLATYTVTFAKLTGPATMAHIHGPAAPGTNAGVLVVLGTPGPASPIAGSATLTPAQAAALEAGQTYVNVHTAENPKGEIRGQLQRAP